MALSVPNNSSGMSLPWLVGKKYTSDITGLTEEIKDFHAYIKPTPEEHAVRINLVDRIRGIVKEEWPCAEVDPFGSFLTGLYLPNSDIDLVILGKWAEKPLSLLEEALEEKKIAAPNSLRVVAGASVQIVKLTEKETGLDVDIGFDSVKGSYVGDYISFYKRKYPTLEALVLILKQFLSVRNLYDRTGKISGNMNTVIAGGLSSYGLVLMVINFLQMYPLPDEATSIDHLGTLLIEFFKFFGSDLAYAVKIDTRFGGSRVPKDIGMDPSHLFIVDPMIPTSDVVGSRSFKIYEIKSEFAKSYQALKNAVTSGEGCVNSHLMLILGISNTAVHLRSHIASRFSSIQV